MQTRVDIRGFHDICVFCFAQFPPEILKTKTYESKAYIDLNVIYRYDLYASR